MARYENRDLDAPSFWEISLDANALTIQLGRCGHVGLTSTKRFESADEARDEYDRLVAQKCRNGYRLVTLNEPIRIARNPILEEAIRAAPVDHLPKRAYAAWLTEQGDPRGEWIALELADDRDPTARARTTARLAEHRARYESQLLGAAFEYRRVIDVTCRHGFLLDLRISYGLSSAPGPAIEDLLAEVLALPVAFAVQRLALGGTGRADPADGRYAAALAVIERIRPPLIALHLGDVNERDRDDVPHGFLGDLDRVYPSLAELQALTIRMGTVRFGVPRLASLRRLELGDGWTSAMLAEIASARCDRLDTLVLDAEERDPADLDALRTAAIPSLRELRIHAPDDTLRVVELLADSPLAAGLERLHLAHGVLDDEAVDSLIRALGRFSRPKVVNLDGQRGLSRNGYRRLGTLPYVIFERSRVAGSETD